MAAVWGEQPVDFNNTHTHSGQWTPEEERPTGTMVWYHTPSDSCNVCSRLKLALSLCDLWFLIHFSWCFVSNNNLFKSVLCVKSSWLTAFHFNIFHQTSHDIVFHILKSVLTWWRMCVKFSSFTAAAAERVSSFSGQVFILRRAQEQQHIVHWLHCCYFDCDHILD